MSTSFYSHWDRARVEKKVNKVLPARQHRAIMGF
jgi:hypothetical protein